jgi:hypothetical protein
VGLQDGKEGLVGEPQRSIVGKRLAPLRRQ